MSLDLAEKCVIGFQCLCTKRRVLLHVCVTFLGILIDTSACELRLPADKLRPAAPGTHCFMVCQAGMHPEGVGVTPGTSLSCGDSGTPRTHLPTPALPSDAAFELLYSSHHGCYGRPCMVEVLSAELEWILLLPTTCPILPCVFRCIR